MIAPTAFIVITMKPTAFTYADPLLVRLMPIVLSIKVLFVKTVPVSLSVMCVKVTMIAKIVPWSVSTVDVSNAKKIKIVPPDHVLSKKEIPTKLVSAWQDALPNVPPNKDVTKEDVFLKLNLVANTAKARRNAKTICDEMPVRVTANRNKVEQNVLIATGVFAPIKAARTVTIAKKTPIVSLAYV